MQIACGSLPIEEISKRITHCLQLIELGIPIGIGIYIGYQFFNLFMEIIPKIIDKLSRDDK